MPKFSLADLPAAVPAPKFSLSDLPPASSPSTSSTPSFLHSVARSPLVHDINTIGGGTARGLTKPVAGIENMAGDALSYIPFLQGAGHALQAVRPLNAPFSHPNSAVGQLASGGAQLITPVPEANLAESLVAGAGDVFKTAINRLATNTATGAVYAHANHRLAGAVTGGIGGELLHHGINAIQNAPVIVKNLAKRFLNAHLKELASDAENHMTGVQTPAQVKKMLPQLGKKEVNLGEVIGAAPYAKAIYNAPKYVPVSGRKTFKKAPGFLVGQTDNAATEMMTALGGGSHPAQVTKHIANAVKENYNHQNTISKALYAHRDAIADAAKTQVPLTNFKKAAQNIKQEAEDSWLQTPETARANSLVKSVSRPVIAPSVNNQINETLNKTKNLKGLDLLKAIAAHVTENTQSKLPKPDINDYKGLIGGMKNEKGESIGSFVPLNYFGDEEEEAQELANRSGKKTGAENISASEKTPQEAPPEIKKEVPDEVPFKQAHFANSAIKKAYRQYDKAGNEHGKSLMRTLYTGLSQDMDMAAKQTPELSEAHKLAQGHFLQNVVPYRAKAIQNIRKDESNLKSIGTTLLNSKHAKVLADLPQTIKNKIIFNKAKKFFKTAGGQERRITAPRLVNAYNDIDPEELSRVTTPAIDKKMKELETLNRVSQSARNIVRPPDTGVQNVAPIKHGEEGLAGYAAAKKLGAVKAAMLGVPLGLATAATSGKALKYLYSPEARQAYVKGGVPLEPWKALTGRSKAIKKGGVLALTNAITGGNNS